MADVRPIEELFGDLIALNTPQQRHAFLDGVCGDDPLCAPAGKTDERPRAGRQLS